MPPSEARTRSDHPLISLVVPVLDEEDCIDEFARRAREAAERAGVRYEILFVDDGSRDATPDRIARLRESNPNVKTIRFTRSFGHQAALAAGLHYAGGDAIVTLDGDLQHPPELLGELLAHWRRGADVSGYLHAGEGLGRGPDLHRWPGDEAVALGPTHATAAPRTRDVPGGDNGQNRLHPPRRPMFSAGGNYLQKSAKFSLPG